MRQIILLIAVMALVGCGKKAPPAQPETNAEPTPAEKAAASKFASGWWYGNVRQKSGAKVMADLLLGSAA